MAKHFNTDTTKILEILTHRLYSETDIFLKELISNGSDACNKINFLITSGQYQGNDYQKKIFIDVNEEKNILTIMDNGIGMDGQDMENFLGTIASSNTRNTIEQLKEKSDLIGQFGIGFYSCFMVANEVHVWSKKYNGGKGYLWTSKGENFYDITEQTDPFFPQESHGTQVQLMLKEDFKHLTNKYQIREIVKKYSNYINVPIVFYDEQDKNETINEGLIPWRTTNLTLDAAKNIYKNILNGMGDIFQFIHQKLQGRYDYTRLIFIPSKSFFIPITRDHKPAIHVYLNGVFVCNDENFLPLYLRFIKGIIEFEDMPINISRENFLQNPFVEQTKKSVKHKILEDLIKSCETNRSEYINSFWNVYGNILKEGIIEDFQDKSMIFDCCLFKSAQENSLITVKEYLEKRKSQEEKIISIESGSAAAQDNNIYYFLNKNEGGHPLMDSFMKKNQWDVLVLKDELEKICLENAYNYGGYNFVNIIDQQETYESTEDEKKIIDTLSAMMAEFKSIGFNSMDMNTLGYIIREQNFMDFNTPMASQLTLNNHHPLVQKLHKINDEKTMKDMVLTMVNLIKIKETLPEDQYYIVDNLTKSYENSLISA
jgi:molecular chaperone HtpG